MNKGGNIKILILLNVLFILIILFYFHYNSPTVFDLTESFSLKGEVVESKTYVNENYDYMLNKIKEANEKYSKDNKKVYLAYGNSNEISVLSYDGISRGEINLITGKSIGRMNPHESKISARKIIPKNNKVKIILNNKENSFDLKENENIYFIIIENE